MATAADGWILADHRENEVVVAVLVPAGRAVAVFTADILQIGIGGGVHKTRGLAITDRQARQRELVGNAGIVINPRMGGLQVTGVFVTVATAALVSAGIAVGLGQSEKRIAVGRIGFWPGVAPGKIVEGTVATVIQGPVTIFVVA